MEYEIFSYGNVDALSGLFNALAALMGGDIFTSAIAIVFVIGFFAAFLANALAPDRLAGPKWLASVILIYLVLFVPKATMHVVDKVGGQPPAVIDNVPLGLAMQAGVVSSIGNTLTELFETALQVLPGNAQLPEELSYTNHGLMFGARLVERSRSLQFSDPAFRADLNNFLQNCTFYDVSQGFIPVDEFASAVDIWPMLSDTNPARFSAVYDAGAGVFDAKPCPDAYRAIDARMQPAVNQLLTKLGLEMNPALQLSGGSSLPGVEALAAIAPQLSSAYARNRIADAATDAANIVRQNALINAVQEATLLSTQRSNDPAATMLGVSRAQATAQFNAQQITSGRMVSEALPLIRNAIEAVLYGLFPFVLLIAMLFGGITAVQMLKSYALGLIWIALWPPIYAIINYLGTLASAKNIAAAAYVSSLGTQGLTLTTASPIYGNAISDLAVVGHLVLAVPMIAAAAVFGVNRIANIAAGLTTGASSASAPNSVGAATGNVSLGNVNFEQQQLSPNRSDAFMSTFRNLEGATSVDTRTGDMRYQQNVGSNVVRLGSSSEISERFGEASTAAHSRGVEQSRQADQALSVALDHALSNASAVSTGTSGSTGYGHREGAGSGSEIQKLAQVQEQLRKDHKVADVSEANSAIKMALGLSVPKEAAKVLPISGGSEGQQRTSNREEAAVAHARNLLEQHGITNAEKLLNDYTKSEDFRHLADSRQEEANRITSSLSESQSLRESASASFRQSEEYRQSAESLKAAALRGEIDWTPEFNRFLHQNGKLGATGDEAVEWANKFFKESGVGIGLDGRPKAVLYDGMGPGNVTVTPGSYRDPEALHQAQQDEPLMIGGKETTREGMLATRMANDGQLGGSGLGSSPAPTSDDALAAGFEAQKGQAQSEIATGRARAEESRAERVREFGDAAEKVSLTQGLGNQPNEGSGHQQVQAENEHLQQEQKEREVKK